MTNFTAIDLSAEMTIITPEKPAGIEPEVLSRQAVVDIKRARYYKLYDQLKGTVAIS